MSSSPNPGGGDASPASRQTSPPSSPDPASKSSSSHAGLSPAHLFTAASVALSLLLLRSGFFNVILVVATSVLLLLNPYVRTFLDLPATSKDGSQSRLFGLLDPAGYFTSFSLARKSDDSEADDEDEDTKSPSKSRSENRELAPLPTELKDALDQLAPLAIRDFVNGWYTHHSFGYPVFPRTVRSTIDHMAASVYTRTLTTRLHAVDLTTELLLTASSVFLTCLRRKRNAKAAADAGDRMAAQALRRGGTGHWNNNDERIASLRSAMRGFFERHLPPNERDSDLIFNLITEVLTKQLWNLILTIGEPDFLNRNLVEWKNRQIAAAAGAPPSTMETSSPAVGGQGRPLPPSRPGSTAPDQQPLSPTASGFISGQEIPRPPSNFRTERHASHSASRPPSTAPPERSPSVSLPSSAGGAPPLPQRSGTLSVPSPGPDRSMISTPPTRSDSPMMPSFVASQQPRAIPRMMSPMRPASPPAGQSSAGPVPPPAGQSSAGPVPPPRMQSPSAYSISSPPSKRGSVGALNSRTSSDLSDGFSAVVGGLGSAIKGIGKGADALAGGIGEALISSQPDDDAEYGHASSRSPYRLSGSHDNAWRDHRPDVLQPAQNAVRRKQPPAQQQKNDEDDAFISSQPAWPSNLPQDFTGMAEGDNLPDSLKSSLRSPPAKTSPSPSPVRISSPPSMMTSQPYQQRKSQDPPRSRPESPHGSRIGGGAAASGAVASAQPQPAPPALPSRPPVASAAPPSGPALPPRPAGTDAPAPRTSSMPPGPSLESVLSRSDDEGLYDAFEAYLENPRRARTAASHDDDASCTLVLGEGEELLRLHIGLATIERLVPVGAGQEAEMFREDASSILSKARDGLRRAIDESPTSVASAVPAKGVAQSLDRAIAQLGFGPQGFEAKEGTVRDALEPVRAKLMTRLQALFDAFWRQRVAAKSATAAATPAKTSASRPTSSGGLAYEPRRKDPHAAATNATPSSTTRNNLPTSGSGPQSQRTSFESNTAAPAQASPLLAKRTSLQAPKPRNAMMDQLIRLGDDDEDDLDEEGADHARAFGADGFEPAGGADAPTSAPSAANGVLVTVTDISSNVDRPNAPVDTKTFEFMCAVEPSPAAMAAGGGNELFESSGGFVLVRRWAEVLTMDRDLRRLPATSSSVPSLPVTKGRTSAMLSSDLEVYLAKVLSSPDLSSTAPVGQFADRTRAAAAAGKAGFNPFSSGVELGRNLGRNFVEGVGAVGKAASTGLQQQLVPPTAGGPGTPAQAGRAGPPMPPPRAMGGQGIEGAAREAGLPASSTGAGQGSGPTLPGKVTSTEGSSLASSAAPSPRGLSPRALDALLTSIFALADEALSLTGAWSMRRGVVRLLQSVIRQSYSAAIVSAFEGTTSALSGPAVARWMDTARTTFWSSPEEGSKWCYVKGAPRTARDRVQSEEAARKVVLGYAPTQAAFVLGPGGKQACERGLEAVHGVVCEDEGALDLVLTLVLRVVQML